MVMEKDVFFDKIGEVCGRGLMFFHCHYNQIMFVLIAMLISTLLYIIVRDVLPPVVDVFQVVYCVARWAAIRLRREFLVIKRGILTSFWRKKPAVSESKPHGRSRRKNR